MAQQLDEFGIPIKTANTSAEVDEFGIPVKKNDQPESINSLDGTLNSVESKKPQANDAFKPGNDTTGDKVVDSNNLNKALNARAMKNLFVAQSQYDNLVNSTKKNLQEVNQIDANINELKKAQFNPKYNQQDALNKINELTQQKEKLKHALAKQNYEIEQAFKHVQYFQDRLQKPASKENDLIDEIQGVAAQLNKAVYSDAIAKPIAGALSLMEDVDSGFGIFKKPNHDIPKSISNIGKTFDTQAEKNPVESTAGQVISGVGSAVPLIVLTSYTGGANLPLILGAQQGLTAYGERGGTPSENAIAGTLGFGEGFKSGASIEAQMAVGGEFGKQLAGQFNLGKVGSATAKGIGVGTAFAVPELGESFLQTGKLGGKDEDKHALVNFLTGAAFEAAPFVGAIREAVKEKKDAAKAEQIQQMDAYNTFLGAPMDVIHAANEIPQSPDLLYKRAANILKRENLTQEEDIAIQTLTRSAGVKELTKEVIDNPAAAIKSIQESNFSPEQKSAFINRVVEVNNAYNPIEIRKNELSEKIVKLRGIIENARGGKTPVEEAENSFLAERATGELKDAERELRTVVGKQIEENVQAESGAKPANMEQPVGATENTGGNGVDPTAKEKGAESVGVKPDLEKAKLEKERLKTLVTAIEKGKPYDKKEVEFFNSDQSELFKKGGVPVELKVALESAKKEAPVTTERQESINKLVELADEYNKLWQGNKGRATESGRELLNRIRQKAKEGGFQIGGGVGRADVVIKNENGNPVRAKYASSGNSETVTDYIPLSEREKSVQDVFRQMSNFSIHSFPTVRNENGYRFSKAQMEKAVDDIKNDRHTVGAKRVLDALDIQVHDGEFKIEDPIYGNQTVSVQEYLDSFKEDFAEEKAIGTQEQAKLASEYDKWFSELTDEEKNKENEHNNIEFKSEAKGSEDAQNQTSSSTKADKTSSTTEGDGKESVKKESTVETNKNQSNDSKSKGKETKREGLLGPGKKFYSYLVSQGMSKSSAALNTALFVFSAARRAKLLGKSVEEVANEYDFSGGARQSRVRYEGNLREENGARLFQENPGAIRGSWSKENGKRILGVFGNAKNTTAVHEALGHDYLDTIIQAAASGHKESSEDIDVLVREFKKDNRHSPSTSELRKQLEEFDVESMDRELDKHAISIHEWFAKKAEEYMANPEMRGASPRLKTLLQKFVDYLKDLHNALAGRKVSEPLQKIFQKAFGEDYDIAKEAIDAEVKNVNEIADISTSATELFNNLLGISNKPTSENKLFDTDFDEARSKETLVALAQKLILDGVDVKDIIPSIKKMISESQASAEQKEFLSKLIDKSAADMILDPPVELGDNKATRRGIQKMLKDPNVPEVVKEQIRKKKDILEYKPITFAEGDAVADAAIRLYGLDVVDKWIKKMLRGNKPDQVYAARVYKKLLEAQTTLANKYAAEGNISMLESTLENWNLDIENAGELSTSVAQQLVMFRGVFGHPELAVRNIQKELTNTQKVKIAKRDKIREMLKEAYDKLEITNEDLLKNTFELEETNEQLRAKISELENETRVRSTPAKSLPKKTSTADNPKEAFEQRVAQLKQMRAARGLSDADSEAAVLKEATEFLFDMDQKAYSFVQYAKKMRAAVDDKLTDRELADAYKAVRDEQGSPLDGDEIIGSVIAKQIVKDEELAAAIQMNKAIASASKAKKDAIASAKKDVLSKLKEAGFKRGDHVDWKKIATERMQNPEKASAIIEDAVSSAGGLSASEKLHMKLDLLSKLDETIKEHKTKLVESILKENDVPTGKKNRGEIDRLVDILNTGDENSSPARLKEAVSKILGIESIKTKDLIRLRELGNSVQGETLRKERQKILQEMWFIQNKYSGSRYGRILADYYYANMLSGPITQVKNATNRFDIWKNVLGAMITSGGDKNIRQVLSGSKNKGIFADTLKSGISLAKTSLATDNFGNYGHVSELEHLEDKPYFEKSIGWLKYVSRTLDGIDGENWVRMYDQSQYRWMVDQFKSQGFTTEVSRQKAKDLMYPIKWDDAIAKAKQIYSQKGEKVSNATLKRAAYDIVQQMREKLAGEQGIDGMEEVGTALANWITFKGDAYGTFELIPTLAQASIKGFTFLNEAAGKIKSPEIRKPAQFIINATRIITIPFVNGVARVVERGFEAAGLGFLKAGFQYREAKKAEGIEQSIMMHQAKETLNSAIGGMVVNVIVMGGLTMASSMFYDKDEDKVKSGFYGSQIGKNPSINGGPRNVWRIFGMNIPVGFLGTQMIPAILAGTVGDYNRNKKLTGGEQKFKLGLAVAKSILEQSMFTSQSNFKEWVGDVVGNTVDEKTKQAIVRSTASTFGNLIPAKSFIQQSLQMYTNADDKEARTFVQNVVKYSFAGIGLDPRIDYLGRVVKTGKKNPESAAGVTEMFNDWGYDGRDKLIASFGSDFSIWNRSQKTLNYNEKPISDEKYYAFQRRANTIFGQYMRQYLPYIKAASVPKGILSDKSFKMSIVKDLHSLSNKQAMSEMNITGGSNQKILKESLDGQIMTIENSLK